MKQIKHKVTLDKCNHISIFNINPINSMFEADILQALNRVSYGGRFKLLITGNKIFQIQFESSDSCYVNEEFSEQHAQEIHEAIVRVAQRIGFIEM